MAINYQEKLKEFTLTGFFSEYLPPCFSLNKRILSCSFPKKSDLVEPVVFSMSRFNNENGRRYISIPEIGSYLTLFKHVKENKIFKELIEFCNQNEVSFSPILSSDGAIVKHEQAYDFHDFDDQDRNQSLYIDNVCRKLIMSAGARKVIQLDISNCFSSFYSHMIPAIILGYDKANSNYKKTILSRNDPSIDSKYKIYEKLDKLVRSQNLNRTNGLLVGPLFSRMIIEGILCRIDKDIKEAHPEIKYSRYVDDYEIYIFDGQSTDSVISIFVGAFRKYGFSINSEKTEINDYPFYVIEDLERIYSQYEKGDLKDYQVMKLFNTFLELEKGGTKGAIRFLLKRLESRPIQTSENDLYKSYILSVLSNDGRSLVKACSILCNQDIAISDNDISLIKNQLHYHINARHDLEILWLLYILIRKNKISEKIITEVLGSGNELAQLMLYKAGVLSSSNISQIMTTCKSWILVYELFLADEISEQDFIQRLNVNYHKELYKELKQNSISFCEIKE